MVPMWVDVGSRVERPLKRYIAVAALWIIVLSVGYLWLTLHPPITLDPAIPALQQENAQARQAIDALKKQAMEHEKQANYWRTEAAKHQQTLAKLKDKVKQLEAERKALKAVASVQEAWQALKGMGY